MKGVIICNVCSSNFNWEGAIVLWLNNSSPEICASGNFLTEIVLRTWINYVKLQLPSVGKSRYQQYTPCPFCLSPTRLLPGYSVQYLETHWKLCCNFTRKMVHLWWSIHTHSLHIRVIQDLKPWHSVSSNQMLAGSTQDPVSNTWTCLMHRSVNFFIVVVVVLV